MDQSFTKGGEGCFPLPPFIRIAVVHSATPRAIHKLRFGVLWSALVLTALFHHETRSLLKKLRQAEALQ
ncbi:MAG: hypothetical protein ACI9R3_003434, partial [Verrucomicrobiales bacterium]